MVTTFHILQHVSASLWLRLQAMQISERLARTEPCHVWTVGILTPLASRLRLLVEHTVSVSGRTTKVRFNTFHLFVKPPAERLRSRSRGRHNSVWRIRSPSRPSTPGGSRRWTALREDCTTSTASRTRRHGSRLNRSCDSTRSAIPSAATSNPLINFC